MAQPANDFDQQQTGQQAVASVYAKALLETTEKSGETATVLEELDALVNQVLANQPKFEQALASPRISAEEKVGLIDRVFAGKISQGLLRFLKVVARHQRLDHLREMRRAYRSLFNHTHGRVEVRVTTATPLPEDLYTQVMQTLQQKLGKTVELVTRTDPNILGGIVVRLGDTVYDASLANRLDRQRLKAIRGSVAKLQEELT